MGGSSPIKVKAPPPQSSPYLSNPCRPRKLETELERDILGRVGYEGSNELVVGDLSSSITATAIRVNDAALGYCMYGTNRLRLTRGRRGRNVDDATIQDTRGREVAVANDVRP
jgi:hypothetical protein